jgi:hypothetical protein
MSIRDRLEECEAFHIFEKLAEHRYSEEELLVMDLHAAAHGATIEKVLTAFLAKVRGKSPEEASAYMQTLMGPGTMVQ